MVQLTEKEKYEIIFRVEINKQSLREISKEMNINRSTVTKWINIKMKEILKECLDQDEKKFDS